MQLKNNMTEEQFERFMYSQNHIATAIEELTIAITEIAHNKKNKNV